MAIKFYSWKDKFKRKKRSHHPHGHGTTFYPATKFYRKPYNRAHRHTSNQLTSTFKKNFISLETLLKKLPRQHKHSASWDSW